MSTPKLAMFTLKVPLSRTILLSPDKVNKGFLHSNFWLSIDKNINTEKALYNFEVEKLKIMMNNKKQLSFKEFLLYKIKLRYLYLKIRIFLLTFIKRIKVKIS